MSEPPVHTSLEDVQAHPRHTGFKTLDLVLALTAIFISGVSLFVAFQHGEIEREMVQASSWPILQLHGEYRARGATTLSVRNAGVGPAKLENFEVLYKGHPVRSVRTLLQSCCAPAGLKPGPMSVFSLGGEVLRAGDQEPFVRLDGSDADHALSESFLAASKDLTFRACYCSVFDQCWLTNLMDLHPAVVKACAAGVMSFNQDEQ